MMASHTNIVRLAAFAANLNEIFQELGTSGQKVCVNVRNVDREIYVTVKLITIWEQF